MPTIQTREHLQRHAAVDDALGSVAYALDLRNIDLRGVDLTRCHFVACDLRGADLSDALLTDAILHVCNLSETNLRGASLSGANLMDCRVLSSDLSDAWLDGACLAHVDFQGSTWRNAQLRDVELTGANAEPGHELSFVFTLNGHRDYTISRNVPAEGPLEVTARMRRNWRPRTNDDDGPGTDVNLPGYRDTPY